MDPGDARVLVVPGKARDALEKTLGRTVDSAERLLKEAAEVAELKIGDATLQLPVEIQKHYAQMDREFGNLLASFNVLSQYASFDLLKKQLPEEAKRLGID